MTTVAGTPITTNCDIPKPQDEDVYEFDLSQPEQVPRVAFADLSLNIPGLREPYIGYHGGINKAAKNLNPEKGLLCILNPYLDMAEMISSNYSSEMLLNRLPLRQFLIPKLQRGYRLPCMYQPHGSNTVPSPPVFSGSRALAEAQRRRINSASLLTILNLPGQTQTLELITTI